MGTNLNKCKKRNVLEDSGIVDFFSNLLSSSRRLPLEPLFLMLGLEWTPGREKIMNEEINVTIPKVMKGKFNLLFLFF